MIKVERKENELKLLIPENLKSELNPDFFSRPLSLLKVNDDVIVLIAGKELKDDSEENVLKLLKTKPLSERVEGIFEKNLNEKEKNAFKLMLENGKVEKFKLSQKYSKSVYKLKNFLESVKVDVKDFKVKESTDVPTLEVNGFMVIKNELLMKRFCFENQEDIKGGKIRGLKGFDGCFYVIDNELCNLLKSKALNAFQKNSGLSLNSLGTELNVSLILSRAVAEFLKEDGEIIEKRKGFFEFIE
ncbi:MAG: hypothetical protein ABH821_04100 [archaeon]